MWPPLFAPVYLLSLLDDVIPGWDLREREKRRERKALTTVKQIRAKKRGSSVVVGLGLRLSMAEQGEKLAESSADNASFLPRSEVTMTDLPNSVCLLF